MKNRDNIKKYISDYAFHLLLLVIFWGGMLRFGFNADSLWHMVVSDADVTTRLTHGRYLIALLDRILLAFDIRTTDSVVISMAITLGIFALAMLVVQRIIVDNLATDSQTRYLVMLAMNFWAINVLFSEILMFSEFCVYSAMAYLFGALAVYFYAKRKYWLTIAFIIFAVCTYQYSVIFAALLVTFYLCIRNECKLSVKVVIEEVICVFVCLFMGFLNLISTDILSNMGVIAEVGKQAGTGDIADKFDKMGESFLAIMKHSYSMMPGNWIPAIVWILVLTILIIGLVSKREKYKIPYILILIFVSILIMYIIPFAGEQFFFPPRMAFTFFLLIGFLFAYGIFELEGKCRAALTVLLIGFLVINLVCVQKIIGNRFVTNTLDEVYARMVDDKIADYEEQTDIQVTKIARAYDEYAPFHYSEVNMAYEQINESAAYSAVSSLMKVMTNRDMEAVDMNPDVYDEYFSGRDWDHFDLNEQVIIVDDTIYWCLY